MRSPDRARASLVAEQEADWRTVIDAMTPSLARTRPADAFTRGLDRLEALLTEKRITGHGDRNELPDRPIVDEDT